MDLEAQANDQGFIIKPESEAKVGPDDFQILFLVQMEFTVFNPTGLFLL